VYRVVVDNPSVRVLRVTVPPGAKTTMHEHPDNVIVSLTDTKVRFTGADGKSQDAEMKADQVIWDAAKKHMGENVGPGGVDALVVELKGSAAPTATVPGDRAGLKATKLIDNPRAVVVRATPDASFSEPAGTTHPWDTVVIALAPSDTHVNVGGKTKDSWQRGDVLFIGRSVAHEAKAGKSPGDILLVAIK
jgi:quercetin dioxygenase-like cupin family protein